MAHTSEWYTTWGGSVVDDVAVSSRSVDSFLFEFESSWSLSLFILTEKKTVVLTLPKTCRKQMFINYKKTKDQTIMFNARFATNNHSPKDRPRRRERFQKSFQKSYLQYKVSFKLVPSPSTVRLNFFQIDFYSLIQSTILSSTYVNMATQSKKLYLDHPIPSELN